ncbi:unnamed protein product [Gordionus sp. m RMFG-2023]
MIQIQSEMSERAIELLAIPENDKYFILDLGCGSGLSGNCISEADHMWIGMDISTSMLDIAIEREVEGDLILSDLGQGIPFRPGSFDAAISISALQWLCSADNRQQSIPKRLYKFFVTLYSSLRRNARAIFQIYPDCDAQIELITKQAMRAGFTGGLVIDFPNSSKAKKIYLCLFAGINLNFTLPKPKLVNEKIYKKLQNIDSDSDEMMSEDNENTSMEDEENASDNFDNDEDIEKGPQTINKNASQIQNSSKSSKCYLSNKRKSKNVLKSKKGRKWIMQKKETWKRRGKKVAHDSKYTGRKRKMKF